MESWDVRGGLKLRETVDDAKSKLERAKVMAIFNFQLNRRISLKIPLTTYSENQFPYTIFSSTLQSISLLTPSNSKNLIFNLTESLPCIAPSIICLGPNLYLIGGMNHQGIPQTTITVLEFNKSVQGDTNFLLKNIQTSPEFSLKIKRKYCATVSIYNKIIAIGGKNIEACDNFEIINVNRQRNNFIGKMTEHKDFVSACVIDFFIYVASPDSNFIDKIDVRDFSISKIELKESLRMIFNSESNLIILMDSGNVIVVNENADFGFVCNVKTRVRWVQSWVSDRGQVYFADFFEGKLNYFNIFQ